MKTKELIKQKALLLFNELGVMNVTLREIANRLNKSYGNITYYYSTKEELIIELFEDMNEELSILHTVNIEQESLMMYFLKLPDFSYKITLKYLFFSKDYVELKRIYPKFFKNIQLLNKARKAKWLLLLVKLKEEGYLKKELIIQDLEYIMYLSVSVRMYYFQELDVSEYRKKSYSKYVNKLLEPYLSSTGLSIYNNMLN